MSKFLSGRLNKLLVGVLGYTENKTVVQTTGKVGIGTTNAQQNSLYVVGDTNITGDTNVGGALTVSQATVSDLTDNRIVVAGTAGRLEDSAGLTFDGSTLTVDGDLQVAGVLSYDDVTNVDSLGIVTARKGLHVLSDGIDVAGVSTFQNDVHLGDSDILNFGDGNDLKISHNGSASNIQQVGTGPLQIRNEVADQDVVIQADNGSGGTAQYFRADGSDGGAKLYNYGSLKLETTGIGVSIYDNLNVGTAVTIYGNTGIVSAISFYGDGANLTNTGATLNAVSGTERLVTTQLTSGTMVDAATDADLTFRASDNLLSTPNIAVSGGISTDGYDTGNQFELMRADGNGGWEWATVPGIFSVNNILNGFNVREEGLIVGTAGSIHTLDFRGLNVTASANPQPNGIATVTMSPTPTFEELYVVGVTSTNNLRVTGVSTFTGAIDANGNLDVDGITELDVLNVAETATFSSNIDANADVDIAGTLDVDGHTLLDNVSISGVTTTSGLLDINAGGQANTFKVEDLTSGRVVLAGTGGELEDSGNLTFDGSTLSVTGDLSVSGTLTYDDVTNIDSIGIITARNGLHVLSNGVNIAGLSTFTGRIVGAATSNVIPFLYANLSDLPSASTYHGAFAHVHATGRAYYAHAANWYELVNKELNGDLIVGTGITMYANTGIVSATAFYGDGSNLLNTGATLNAATGTQRLVLTGLTSGTMVDAATDSDLAYNASDDRLIVANLDISGITTLGGPVTAGSSEGAVGQYLRHVGTGVTWANFPTLRTTSTNTASAGQTTFNFTYNTNFLDVFVNGVKLSPSEYTATNGSQIILNTAAFADEIVEFHSYNTASTYGGGGGGSYGNSDVDNHLNVSGASSGEVLGWNGSDYDWVAQTAAYTNSDVDTHLNRSTAGTGEVLSWNGSDYDWVAQSSGITTANINADTLNVSGITTLGNLQFDTAGAHIEFTASAYSGSAPYMEFWVGNNNGTHYAQIDGGNAGQLQIMNTSHPTGTLDFRAKEDFSFQVNGYYSIYSPSNGGVKLYHPGSQGNILSHKFETTSTGAIVTGVLTATSFSGSGSSLTGLTGASAATYGNGTAVPQITVDANGRITGITNVSISGGGGGGGTSLFIRDSGSLVGAAGTIDFGTGLSVSPVSAGIVTVTSGIGTAIINADTIDSGSLNVSGISTFSNGLTVPAQQTIATGANFTLSSNSTGNITELRHSGSNNTLRYRADNHQFMNEGATTTRMSIGNDGVSLNHDNISVLKTVGAGVTIGIPNYPATLFTNQLSVSGVSTFTGAIDANNNLDVAGTLTVSNTTTLNNTINVADNVVANFGASSDGRISYTSSTNRFYVRVPGGSGDLILGAGPAVRITSANGLTDRAVFTSTGATITGTASATTFSGSGASLTTLNASELDSGTIPDARFPATLPAVSGANLTNLPAPTPADTDIQATFDVSSNGSSAYRFTGPGNSGSDDNPDLYLVRGQRYRFINTTGSSHPFEIRVSNGGSAYTDGITGSTSGTQDFNIQHDAPAKLFYQCTIHSGMVGTIYIVGGDQFIPDGEKLSLGTDADLEIEHTGSGSFIRTSASSNGDLAIEARGTNHDLYLTAADDIYIRPQGGEDGIKVHGDGSVELFYDGAMRFQTNSDAVTMRGGGAHRCEGNFRPWSANTYDLGTSGDRWNKVYTNGVLFNGDTSANNTLDDYEEGTWSPAAFNNASSSSTNSTNTRYATYIKIGRLVHIQAYIEVSKGSVGNAVNYTINDLPFTVDGTNNLHSAISVGYYNGLNVAASGFYATAQPNTTELLIRYTGGSGGTAVSTAVGQLLSSTHNIIFGGTYMTTA